MIELIGVELPLQPRRRGYKMFMHYLNGES